MDKLNTLHFFTWEQGNILVRLLIAHLLSDFVFQTTGMVTTKKWLSASMFLHIAIVYLSTALLTGWWGASLIIAVLHYLIDGAKIEAQRKMTTQDLHLFIADQGMHLLTIVGTWATMLHLWTQIRYASSIAIHNYHITLIILGYLVVTLPVGYIIKFTTQAMLRTAIPQTNEETGATTQHGGKRIGIYERIIILTLVLLGQYEAISFLITAKGLIRFVSRDEHIRSEYVLVGTMMSYAFSIGTGVCLNWLLHIK